MLPSLVLEMAGRRALVTSELWVRVPETLAPGAYMQLGIEGIAPPFPNFCSPWSSRVA